MGADPTDTFLIFSNLASAQARSAVTAAAVHCDGTQTKYWWNSIPLTNGTGALQIKASGKFSKIVVTANATSALTPAEQSALVPFSTVQPLLPS